MKINDKFDKVYLSIIREQEEETCPECGNNPCTCEQGGCGFTNYAELIKKYSENVSTEGLIELLNIAVNDELLAAYNYLASYTLSKTEGKSDFDPEFKAHETEEFDHAHILIERLRELNAAVLMTPWCDIAKCNSAGKDWAQEMDATSTEILLRRFQEELNAIDFYSFILGYIKEIAKGNESEFDSTTHRLIKKIKADEEEHAKDLRDLLTEYGIEFSEDTNPEAYGINDDEDDFDDEEDDFDDDEEDDTDVNDTDVEDDEESDDDEE